MKAIISIILFVCILTGCITTLLYFGYNEINAISTGLDLSYEYRQLYNNCEISKFILDNKEEIYIDKVVEAKQYYENFCINRVFIENEE